MEKHVVIELFSADVTTELKLNFAEGGIFAGFPSPAQDYMELSIDLNTELIKHPASTFFGRVRGNSLCDAGVEEGDILVIDKSLYPSDGDMEFTLKFIHFEPDDTAPDKIWLMPANDAYQPIMVTPDNDFLVWGVVTYTIKKRK